MFHPSLLLIDDDPALREALSATIQIHFPDVNVVVAGSEPEALRVLNEHQFDLVICDLIMPGGGGGRLIPQIRTRFPEIPVYLLTGCLYPEHMYRHVDATGFIKKPIDRQEFIDTLRRTFACREQSKSVREFTAAVKERAAAAAAHAETVKARLESRLRP